MKKFTEFVAEAKDPGEYDQEGQMAMTQLNNIVDAAEDLLAMLDEDENLPEWVQNKVTKATDYIRSVRDYLDAENGNDEEEDDEEDDEDESMKESVELDEISRDLARRYIRKVADKTNTGELSTKQVMKRKPGVTLAGKKAYPGVAGEPRVRATESVEQIDEISKNLLRKVSGKMLRRGLGDDPKADKHMKSANLASAKLYPDQYKNSPLKAKVPATESVEQIDELDKKTLGSYIKKASTNQIGNTAKVLAGKNDPETERARKRMGQRMSGIAKATDKLTKEEAEQIDELKKSTLGSYIKKSAAERGHAGIEAGAGASGSKDQKDAMSTMKKRLKGIKMATDRLTKEEVEQIDELSKKTLGSYVKKAKDDLGNREAEVTRNRYVDPRGVKDPVKYNNALLMKRANRRDNINKAVDKLTKEEVKSSDKKPEKYTRPDGKVAYRMVVTDKKVIKND